MSGSTQTSLIGFEFPVRDAVGSFTYEQGQQAAIGDLLTFGFAHRCRVRLQ